MSFTSKGPLPTNKHVSISPDGHKYVDLSFVSEPLGLPSKEGYGWPRLEFGNVTGKDHQYTIIRKLGWGMHSSIWLANDTANGAYVAIKAMTGYIIDLYRRSGIIWELDALHLPSYLLQSPHSVNLPDEFYWPGHWFRWRTSMPRDANL